MKERYKNMKNLKNKKKYEKWMNTLRTPPSFGFVISFSFWKDKSSEIVREVILSLNMLISPLIRSELASLINIKSEKHNPENLVNIKSSFFSS